MLKKVKTIIFMLALSILFAGNVLAITIYCPWIPGQSWQAGGVGSYWNQKYHKEEDLYAIDFNRNTSCDRANDYNEPILAPFDGKIVKIYYSSSYGWNVIIQSKEDANYTARLAHLIGDPKVTSGIWVGKDVCHGQEIGRCGSTGKSTGPHLHFALYYKGNAAKPNYIGGYALTESSSGICMTSNNKACTPSSDPTLPYITIFWPTPGQRVVNRPYRVEMRVGIEDKESGIDHYKIYFQDITNPGEPVYMRADVDAKGETTLLLDSKINDGFALNLMDLKDDIDIRLTVEAKNGAGMVRKTSVVFHKNTVPPSPPLNFSLLSAEDLLEVSWKACTSPDIAGYRVSWGYHKNEWPYYVDLPQDVTKYSFSSLTNRDYIQVVLQTIDKDGHLSDYTGGDWGGKQARATWHPDNVVVRVPSGACFTKIDGQWRLFPNSLVLASYGIPRDDIINITEYEYNRYPRSGNMQANQATLIKIKQKDSTYKYYVADNGYLRELHGDAVPVLGYELYKALEFTLDQTGMVEKGSLMADQSHPVGTLLKTASNPTIFRVSGPFQMEGFTSMPILYSYWAETAPVLIVSQEVLDRYELTGLVKLKNGCLVQKDGEKTIYYKEHGVLRGITNYPTFCDFGWHLARVLVLNESEFDRETIGDPIDSASIWESRILTKHVDGTFVNNRDKYAFIREGKLSMIYRSTILYSYGLGFDDCVKISDLEWGSYEMGKPASFRPGTLIQIGGEISIVGFDGIYYPFCSFSVFLANGHNPDAVINLTDEDAGWLRGMGIITRSDKIICGPEEHIGGELVKVGTTVFYLNDNGQYVGFNSSDCFLSYHYGWNMVKEVSLDYLTTNFSDGGLMPFANGVLVRSEIDTTVYLIDHGVGHALTLSAFLGLGYSNDMVHVIKDSAMKTIPIGSVITGWICEERGGKSESPAGSTKSIGLFVPGLFDNGFDLIQ